jgi:hypothetical protein
MKITVNPTQANEMYTNFTTGGPGFPNPPTANGYTVLYSSNGTNVSDVTIIVNINTSSYWLHHTGSFSVTTLLGFFPAAIQVDDISE